MGYVTVVIDFDVAAGTGKIVHRQADPDGDSPPMVIGVSPDGEQFAVSTDSNVNVFHRNAAGVFAKIGFDSITAPLPDQEANSIQFAEETGGGSAAAAETFFAIAWTGAEGESTGSVFFGGSGYHHEYIA